LVIYALAQAGSMISDGSLKFRNIGKGQFTTQSDFESGIEAGMEGDRVCHSRVDAEVLESMSVPGAKGGRSGEVPKKRSNSLQIPGNNSSVS
jgi:hypothetical protein